MFLLIIPSCAVVFAAIGALDHFGLWTGIQAGINTMLNAFNIHAETGSVSILVGGSLAMAQLKEIAATIAPPLVVGSYILASSGFPLQVIFGRSPLSGAAVPTLPNARP